MKAKKELIVLGQKWQLHKDAEDSTVPFAYERVKVENYVCEAIDTNIFILLVFGVIPPVPGTIEKPASVLFVGFANRYIPPSVIGLHDMAKMHIYKCDMVGTAREIATAFFDQNRETSGAPEITPFPAAANENRSAAETTED